MRRQMLFLGLFFPLWVAAQAPQLLDKVVAVVNDNVITTSELDHQMMLLRQQLAARKAPMPPDDVLRKQVLQHLIDEDIQLQLAKRNEITVEAAELDQAIERIATTNHITVPQLRSEVEKQGFTWTAFKENIKKEMIIHRIQQKAVDKDIAISAEQIDNFLKTNQVTQQEKQVFHLQNIVIPLPENPTAEQYQRAKEKAKHLLSLLNKGADFSAIPIAESSAGYELEGGDLGNRTLSQLPEIFAKKVVKMKVGEVAGPIKTENGYQLIKLVSLTGEDDHHEVIKTHVRHILIKADANLTAEEAKHQIDNIYQQIKSGKDFGVMAKQYSVDTASAIKQGDLGWVTADELVPQFAQAMDKLPLNQISQPVKSPFGWHLIQVLERKKTDDSEAYKRQQARQMLHQRKFNEAVQNWQHHLRADAYIKVMDKSLA